MNCKLEKIWTATWEDVYQMLQEIAPQENWISNDMYWKTLDEFEEWKKARENESRSIWLKDWEVPMTTYCMYADGQPVWIGKLRHYLVESLMNRWGNIWYIIAPSGRGKWYWTKILELLLKEAKSMWLQKVLLTCDEDNIWSYKIIEKNNWILENIVNWKRRYWISL